MAVAIVRDGTIVFEKGYGDANIAKKLPVTPETPFADRIAYQAVHGGIGADAGGTRDG